MNDEELEIMKKLLLAISGVSWVDNDADDGPEYDKMIERAEAIVEKYDTLNK